MDNTDPQAPMTKWMHELAKSRQDRWLGGVCGGLGEHSPAPAWMWRAFFVILMLVAGTGLLAYLILWIFMPAPNARRER